MVNCGWNMVEFVRKLGDDIKVIRCMSYLPTKYSWPFNVVKPRHWIPQSCLRSGFFYFVIKVCLHLDRFIISENGTIPRTLTLLRNVNSDRCLSFEEWLATQSVNLAGIENDMLVWNICRTVLASDAACFSDIACSSGNRKKIIQINITQLVD